MEKYKGMTDEELISALKKYSIAHGPVVGTTRKLYERKIYEFETQKTKHSPSKQTYTYSDSESPMYESKRYDVLSREGLSKGSPAYQPEAPKGKRASQAGEGAVPTSAAANGSADHTAQTTSVGAGSVSNSSVKEVGQEAVGGGVPAVAETVGATPAGPPSRQEIVARQRRQRARVTQAEYRRLVALEKKAASATAPGTSSDPPVPPTRPYLRGCRRKLGSTTAALPSSSLSTDRFQRRVLQELALIRQEVARLHARIDAL
ncbi:emerin isoform X1 [Lissotriton helveticus]